MGTICIILGIVLVIGALSLFLYNLEEGRRAGVAVDEVLPQVVAAIDTDSAADPYDTSLTKVLVDGYSYIGFVSLPTLGLELPVMADWSYEQLKIAPCRFSGSVKTDDLVIAAHNYSQHFGNIKNLKVGDVVYFTDMDGVCWTYEVVALDVLAPTAVEDMTAGDYDLTLFTCTYGGQSRVTVRCDRTA